MFVGALLLVPLLIGVSSPSDARTTHLRPVVIAQSFAEQAPSSAGLDKTHDAGSLEGQVVNVDYQRGVILIATAKGRVEVVVLPSTNIQDAHNSSFRTIADISKGSRVKVFMSQRGVVFTAQIIQLR